MSKNTKDKLNKSHAKVDLVRNPFLFPISEEVKSKIKSGEIDESIFVIKNQDEELSNKNVSCADEKYEVANKVRESSNIRYIKVSSEIIPDEYLSKLIIGGARSDEDFLVPYDYHLITRSDNTQFLFAEDFSVKSKNPSLEELHRYSILRYSGKRNDFYSDLIYGNIDSSRLLSGDQAYIDTFANDFLSEKRLNESLMTTSQSKDAQHSDETDHAEHYVGYINSRSLEIGSDYNENTLPLLGELIKDEVNIQETRLIKYSNKLIDRLFRALQKINNLRQKFREEVIDVPKLYEGKALPNELLSQINEDFILNIKPEKENVADKEKDKNSIEVPLDEKGNLSIEAVKAALARREEQQISLAALKQLKEKNLQNDEFNK